MVCWQFATQKNGTSALTLQKNLEIGSYQTAWALQHRLRSVLVRPGRERLVGTVEVDETYVGGNEPGVHLGRAKGKKSMVGITVERIGARASGRCRMALLRDASAESLRAFLRDHVEEGSTVVSDGWKPYQGATAALYVHGPLVGHGPAGSKLLPRVHRVAGLAKRWMLSTHQGSIRTDHLASYLNEFVFRFNRRRSRSHGLVFFRVLELAVLHEPVRYRDLIAHAKPGVGPSPPPRTYRHPASLERPRVDRPRRAAPPIHSG